jgi:membrane protease YdiL (CAAX protease family)
VFYAACLLLLLVAATVAKSLQDPESVLFIGASGALGSWLLSWMFVRWDGLTLATIGARPQPGSATRFVLGFIVGLLLILLHALALHVFGHVTFERSPSPQPFKFAIAAVAYLLLASREELAFHGYPLRRLATLAGPWPALALVSLVFVAEHVAGGASWLAAVAGAGAGSLLFGLASLVTRGLAVPIGIHAAWNYGDWLRSSGGKVVGGLWRPVVESGFESRAAAVGWISYVVLMLAASAAIFWWRAARDSADQPMRP